MTYGIIDIGSNTIRLNIYKIKGDSFELLLSKKEAAGLVQYVKKEKMSDEGIHRLAECLNRFKEMMDLLHLDGYAAFATASLRNINNSKEVIEAIWSLCQIRIDLLSGAQEGRISFHGAIHGLHYDSGIYVDTGGGSSEIILYDQKQIGFVTSLPVGSLNLFNKYVSNIIPSKSEIKTIQDRLLKELKACDQKKSILRCDDLAVTGGSMRAIRSLLVEMKWIKDDVYELDACMLKNLIKTLQNDIGQTIHLFLKVKPDRVHTMFTGLLIIDTIARYTKAKRIQVSTNGVREGYLMEKILGE